MGFWSALINPQPNKNNLKRDRVVNWLNAIEAPDSDEYQISQAAKTTEELYVIGKEEVTSNTVTMRRKLDISNVAFSPWLDPRQSSIRTHAPYSPYQVYPQQQQQSQGTLAYRRVLQPIPPAVAKSLKEFQVDEESESENEEDGTEESNTPATTELSPPPPPPPPPPPTVPPSESEPTDASATPCPTALKIAESPPVEAVEFVKSENSAKIDSVATSIEPTVDLNSVPESSPDSKGQEAPNAQPSPEPEIVAVVHTVSDDVSHTNAAEERVGEEVALATLETPETDNTKVECQEEIEGGQPIPAESSDEQIASVGDAVIRRNEGVADDATKPEPGVVDKSETADDGVADVSASKSAVVLGHADVDIPARPQDELVKEDPIESMNTGETTPVMPDQEALTSVVPSTPIICATSSPLANDAEEAIPEALDQDTKGAGADTLASGGQVEPIEEEAELAAPASPAMKSVAFDPSTPEPKSGKAKRKDRGATKAREARQQAVEKAKEEVKKEKEWEKLKKQHQQQQQQQREKDKVRDEDVSEKQKAVMKDSKGRLIMVAKKGGSKDKADAGDWETGGKGAKGKKGKKKDKKGKAVLDDEDIDEKLDEAVILGAEAGAPDSVETPAGEEAESYIQEVSANEINAANELADVSPRLLQIVDNSLDLAAEQKLEIADEMMIDNSDNEALEMKPGSIDDFEQRIEEPKTEDIKPVVLSTDTGEVRTDIDAANYPAPKKVVDNPQKTVADCTDVADEVPTSDVAVADEAVKNTDSDPGPDLAAEEIDREKPSPVVEPESIQTNMIPSEFNELIEPEEPKVANAKLCHQLISSEPFASHVTESSIDMIAGGSASDVGPKAANHKCDDAHDATEEIENVENTPITAFQVDSEIEVGKTESRSAPPTSSIKEEEAIIAAEASAPIVLGHGDPDYTGNAISAIAAGPTEKAKAADIDTYASEPEEQAESTVPPAKGSDTANQADGMIEVPEKSIHADLAAPTDRLVEVGSVKTDPMEDLSDNEEKEPTNVDHGEPHINTVPKESEAAERSDDQAANPEELDGKTEVSAPDREAVSSGETTSAEGPEEEVVPHGEPEEIMIEDATAPTAAESEELGVTVAIADVEQANALPNHAAHQDNVPDVYEEHPNLDCDLNIEKQHIEEEAIPLDLSMDFDERSITPEVLSNVEGPSGGKIAIDETIADQCTEHGVQEQAVSVADAETGSTADIDGSGPDNSDLPDVPEALTLENRENAQDDCHDIEEAEITKKSETKGLIQHGKAVLDEGSVKSPDEEAPAVEAFVSLTKADADDVTPVVVKTDEQLSVLQSVEENPQDTLEIVIETPLDKVDIQGDTERAANDEDDHDMTDDPSPRIATEVGSKEEINPAVVTTDFIPPKSFEAEATVVHESDVFNREEDQASSRRPLEVANAPEDNAADDLTNTTEQLPEAPEVPMTVSLNEGENKSISGDPIAAVDVVEEAPAQESKKSQHQELSQDVAATAAEPSAVISTKDGGDDVLVDVVSAIDTKEGMANGTGMAGEAASKEQSETIIGRAFDAAPGAIVLDEIAEAPANAALNVKQATIPIADSLEEGQEREARRRKRRSRHGREPEPPVTPPAKHGMLGGLFSGVFGKSPAARETAKSSKVASQGTTSPVAGKDKGQSSPPRPESKLVGSREKERGEEKLKRRSTRLDDATPVVKVSTSTPVVVVDEIPSSPEEKQSMRKGESRGTEEKFKRRERTVRESVIEERGDDGDRPKSSPRRSRESATRKSPAQEGERRQRRRMESSSKNLEKDTVELGKITEEKVAKEKAPRTISQTKSRNERTILQTVPEDLADSPSPLGGESSMEKIEKLAKSSPIKDRLFGSLFGSRPREVKTTASKENDQGDQGKEKNVEKPQLSRRRSSRQKDIVSDTASPEKADSRNKSRERRIDGKKKSVKEQDDPSNRDRHGGDLKNRRSSRRERTRSGEEGDHKPDKDETQERQKTAESRNISTEKTSEGRPRTRRIESERTHRRRDNEIGDEERPSTRRRASDIPALTRRETHRDKGGARRDSKDAEDAERRREKRRSVDAAPKIDGGIDVGERRRAHRRSSHRPAQDAIVE